MIKSILRISLLVVLNFIVLYKSTEIDIDQLLKDMNILFGQFIIDQNLIFVMISIFISLFTILLFPMN